MMRLSWLAAGLSGRRTLFAERLRTVGVFVLLLLPGVHQARAQTGLDTTGLSPLAMRSVGQVQPLAKSLQQTSRQGRGPYRPGYRRPRPGSRRPPRRPGGYATTRPQRPAYSAGGPGGSLFPFLLQRPVYAQRPSYRPQPASQPRPAPQPAQAAPGAGGSAFEIQEVGLISQYRQQNGLNALSIDARLSAIALGHSQDMANRQSMDHNGFDQRFAQAQQYGATRCVENVAWNYNDPQSLFTAWQNSPEHNANMLDSAIRRAGVAIVNGYSTFFACN